MNFVTITPPSSYVHLLLIIGPEAAGGGIESEQQITIILVLLLARLQLRLQLRCIIREAVEYFHDFLLYFNRRYRYEKILNHRFSDRCNCSINSLSHYKTLKVSEKIIIRKLGNNTTIIKMNPIDTLVYCVLTIDIVKNITNTPFARDNQRFIIIFVFAVV